MMGQVMTAEDYAANNRETFRPVSILESGLDINENEFNYELNKNNLATIHEGMNTTFFEGA